MSKIEDPIWVGRPKLGKSIIPLALSSVASLVGVVTGLLVLYKLIFASSTNLSMILIVELLGVFAYCLFYLKKQISILHYGLYSRYFMFHDRIEIVEGGLLNSKTTLYLKDIRSLSRVEYENTELDTIYIHSNIVVDHRSFDYMKWKSAMCQRSSVFWTVIMYTRNWMN